MQEGKETGTYQYRYSATDQKDLREEVERIRNQYMEKEIDSRKTQIEKLQRLDQKVKNPAMISSLSAGIMGTMLFGGGLSLILAFDSFLLGILLGVFGLVILGSAYPIYCKMINMGKEKYGKEIIELSEKILHQDF